MNFDLIYLFFLVLSFAGICILAARKADALLALPETGIFIKEETKEKMREKAKEEMKKGAASFEKFLQKVLSKTRIFSLRADKRLSEWMFKLRQRSQGRALGLDGYWKEIKASVKKKEKKTK